MLPRAISSATCNGDFLSHLPYVIHSYQMISKALLLTYLAFAFAVVFAEDDGDGAAASPSSVFKKV